jgi:PTS hybrid protein
LVGIVLVSHSARLAEGLAEVLGQIAGTRVRVVPVQNNIPRLQQSFPGVQQSFPGVQQSFPGVQGASPQSIVEAIHQADGGSGVVVFADMGSSVLAVRALLKEGLLEGKQVALADAPFVEGASAALSAILQGKPLQQVVWAAKGAWQRELSENTFL